MQKICLVTLVPPILLLLDIEAKIWILIIKYHHLLYLRHFPQYHLHCQGEMTLRWPCPDHRQSCLRPHPHILMFLILHNNLQVLHLLHFMTNVMEAIGLIRGQNCRTVNRRLNLVLHMDHLCPPETTWPRNHHPLYPQVQLP